MTTENTTEIENTNETTTASVLKIAITQTLFELGKIVATPNAIETMKTYNCLSLDLLMRHLSGDWGVIPEEDAEENQHALVHGNRIMSSYPLADGVKIWVITEADRSYTTFLLPEEY